MEREFKSLQKEVNGKTELVDLSAEQSNRIPTYIKALETAANSKVPKPTFSQYYVKESIGSRTLHEAGNVEYGLCQALHGEESAVAILRASQDTWGISDTLVMGIIAGNPGNVAAPCGNCRDIMLDSFGPDLEVVSGAADGGLVVVAKMRDYLFETFMPEESTGFVRAMVANILVVGDRIVCDGYSPSDVHPERKYFAMLRGGGLSRHYGALSLKCDYHPIYPLRDAIRQAEREHDPCLRQVFIVGQDISETLADVPPHVMYKDRQHLMEFNLGQELLTGQDIDPPVFLIRCLRKADHVQAHRVWRTSVKEWLPFPFSPRNFGPKFVSEFTRYLKSRL